MRSDRSPKIPVLGPEPVKITTPNRRQILSSRNDQDINTERDEIQDRLQLTAQTEQASIWTDDRRSSLAQESPFQPQGFKIVFPTPSQPVCNTAEWFMEQQQQQQQQQNDSLKTPTPISSQNPIRESLLHDIDIKSPSAARASRVNGLNGLPKTPKLPKLGVSVSIKSMKGKVHYVHSCIMFIL